MKIKKDTEKKEDQLIRVRHSLSHLMAAAIITRWPKVKLAIGPVIENGFYYDFDFSAYTQSKKRAGNVAPISDSDLEWIENQMREYIQQDLIFSKKNITPAQAVALFKNAPYKRELIGELRKEKKSLSIYQTTRGTGKNAESVFFDLCSGPHINKTSQIDPLAFKLKNIAGAYWRGDEKNTMLTRVYGVAFLNQKDLQEYLTIIAEAEKRDHRKLGRDLDLFHIDEAVGLGLPLWHPRGALLWRIIEEFWYKEHIKGGYDLVRTPHIGSRTLWETSGHWGFYNASMYPPIEAGQTLEDRQQKKKASSPEEYLLKPMNCPFHVQIYKNQLRSYREFPFRWAECGTVYRFEKKGELSGLTRVRGFTQDDAHIICRKDQVEDELKRVIDFILFIYKSFGFSIDSVHVYLSLRDPKNKTKYVGGDAGWKFAENVLRSVAIEKKLAFTEEIGEAAFYGPKLDFKIKDALGRQWQCSTLQFDFNLPSRFSMSFVNNEGKSEQPYMLHRALFGSYERFIGLLIEHYAGAFPVWLSPVQATILPISEKHAQYAQLVAQKLKEKDIRVTISEANETLGKRIREAELEKAPYILVVGDKEKDTNTVSVRSYHKGQLGQMSVDSMSAHIADEINKHL